ncbi:MAG TPA: glycerol-3-phosphate acyltransferase [Bacteroidaceae bacterium]|nr:glycerol-3-phosphate acyltransferase [Bacteroidaceae bacterium]
MFQYALILLICLILSYLSGSVNFAILISKWAKGIDIRQAGNKNPGTSNVRREVGMGWAALVFFGDLAKGLVPLILTKQFIFTDDVYTDIFSLFLIGMAAITGHCWPIYHGFKGGGGLATSIGVYMFFVPAEFFLALLISFSVVRLFLSEKKYSVGQLTPMIFVPLAPVLVILNSLFVEIKVTSDFIIGNYPWYIITGVIVLSLYIFMINIRIVANRFSKDNPNR